MERVRNERKRTSIEKRKIGKEAEGKRKGAKSEGESEEAERRRKGAEASTALRNDVGGGGEDRNGCSPYIHPPFKIATTQRGGRRNGSEADGVEV